MKDFYQRNKWSIWVILASILLIVIAVLWRKYTNRPTAAPKVSITIDAPAKISSGSEVIYKVTFANNDHDAIKSLHLDMLYPQGFIFETSSPKPSTLNGTQFTLPDLTPSQEGTIMIKGTLSGNVGETKTVNGVMHYSYANFNSDFVAQAQAQTAIQDSNLLIQFEGPNKTSNNQQITYAVDYTNATDQDISAAKLKLDLPTVFTVSKYDKSPGTDGFINLDKIPANSSGKFSFTGMFTGGQAGDQQMFNASISGQQGDKPSLLLGTAQYSISIDQIPLSLSVSGSDNSSQNQGIDIVHPGDSITYKLDYKNNSSIPAKNAVITLTLNGSAYDLTTLQAQNASVNGNVVTWDASQVPGLANLGPNASGSVSLVVQIKNPATKNTATNLTVSVNSSIKTDEYQNGFVGNTLTSKIATAVSIAADATAIDATTYLVSVSLRNSTNDLNGAVVTLSLPNAQGFSSASFVGPEAAKATWTASSKKVTWNVGTLAAHTGDFSALRKLQFNITIPSGSSTSSGISLIKNMVLSGTDSFTTQKITVSAQDLNTP